MNSFLILAFLFFIGSISGWIIELIYRRFFSRANTERKWINPGFCTGPYVPLYGFGLCILYIIALLEPNNLINHPIWNKIVLFISMAISMTVIEYIAGICCLKLLNIRLWDYSDRWGNIQGIICPLFSLYWSLLGAAYYFLIHPQILNALDWLSQNLAFSFVIGLFFGVFIIDVCHSAELVNKLRQFAIENNVVVRFENLKMHIRNAQDKSAKKYHFFSPFRTEHPLSKYLKDMRASFELRRKALKNNKK